MNSFTVYEATEIFKACEGECFYCSKKLTFVHRKKAWHTDHLVKYPRVEQPKLQMVLPHAYIVT